jgi:hypothetical protein
VAGHRLGNRPTLTLMTHTQAFTFLLLELLLVGWLTWRVLDR